MCSSLLTYNQNHIYKYKCLGMSVCFYLCVSVYASVCVSECLSVYVCISVSMCVSLYVLVCVSMCVCLYVCVGVCMRLFVCLSLCICVYACICMPVCVCLCVFVCLSVYLCLGKRACLRPFLEMCDLSACACDYVSELQGVCVLEVSVSTGRLQCGPNDAMVLRWVPVCECVRLCLHVTTLFRATSVWRRRAHQRLG